jgi:hypothetical protein
MHFLSFINRHPFSSRAHTSRQGRALPVDWPGPCCYSQIVTIQQQDVLMFQSVFRHYPNVYHKINYCVWLPLSLKKSLAVGAASSKDHCRKKQHDAIRI